MSWVPAPNNMPVPAHTATSQTLRAQPTIMVGSRREVDMTPQVSAQTLPQQWSTYQPPQPQPQPYIGGLSTPGGIRTTLPHSTPQSSVRSVENNMYANQGMGSCSPKQQPHIARILSNGAQTAYPLAGTRRQVNPSQPTRGVLGPSLGPAMLGQEKFHQAVQMNNGNFNEAMQNLLSIGRADAIEGISSVGGSPVHYPHGSPMHQPHPVRSPHGVEGIASVGGTPFTSRPGGGMIDGMEGTPVQPVGDTGLVQPPSQPSYVPPVLATSRAASPPSHSNVSSSAVARSSSCEGRAASASSGQVKVNVYYQNGKAMDAEKPGRMTRTFNGGQNLINVKKWFKDLVGVYHVGIEVHDMEFTFGAYRASNSRQLGNDNSGVYMHNARRPGPMYDFCQSVELGSTKYTLAEIERIGEELGGNGFAKGEYNLVHHNCHNFCNTLAARLGVNAIPGWCTRGADFAKMVGIGGQAPPLAPRNTSEEAGTTIEPYEMPVSSNIPMSQDGNLQVVMAR